MDVHRLYVYKVGPSPQNEAEAKARATTIQILRYAKGIKPALKQMGVDLRIIPLTRKALSNADVRRKLQTVLRASRPEPVKVRFPALRTPADAYVGVEAIRRVYDTNVQAFRRHQGGGGPMVDESDDPLAAYYAEEMTGAGAARDRTGEEAPVGEEGDMMSAYRDMMKRRTGRRPKKAPVVPGGAPLPGKAPVVPKRAGNVGGGGDDPLAALDMLGGDGDDPAGSAADDLMMRSYLENLEES